MEKKGKKGSMDPGTWGPKLWSVLFSASRNLTTPDFVTLLNCLKDLLPCIHCKTSFQLYCKEFDPIICIREDDADSSLRFVWAIKDKVNQKIRQTCIPFSRVVNRSQVYSQFASAFDVMDIICLVSLEVKTEQEGRSFYTAAPILCRLAERLDERPSLKVTFPQKMKNPDSAWLYALECMNSLLKERQIPSRSKDDFLNQYTKCKAQELKPTTPVVRSRGVPKSVRSKRIR